MTMFAETQVGADTAEAEGSPGTDILEARRPDMAARRPQAAADEPWLGRGRTVLLGLFLAGFFFMVPLLQGLNLAAEADASPAGAVARQADSVAMQEVAELAAR